MGLSAACGKAGAAIGVVAFGAIQSRLGEDVYGQRGVFLVGAAFSLLGALVTILCIPKVSVTLWTFVVAGPRLLLTFCGPLPFAF